MADENQEPKDRKTLDDRAKMTELERIRHSCAHVMATAILKLWPDAQFAAGPPVENGFYYDVELQHRISPQDFPAIEAEMQKEIKANNVFEKIVVTREQALKDSESGRLGGLSERPGNPSKFKLGNLDYSRQITAAGMAASGWLAWWMAQAVVEARDLAIYGILRRPCHPKNVYS